MLLLSDHVDDEEGAHDEAHRHCRSSHRRLRSRACGRSWRERPVQVKPQVTARSVDVQVAKVQRAQVATSLQRHLVQVAHAKRFSLIRAYVR